MTNRYTVDGILVEATKSIGGLFYEVTAVKTGQTIRVLVKAFESVAKPVPEIMSSAADPEAAT
jgi:hypothetical protein